MRRTLATLALAVALVLAGCPGGGESGTAAPTTDSPDGPATNGVGATPTPVPLADDHPYVTADTLDMRALVRAHLQRLRALESYMLDNNVTAEYAANGSAAGSATRLDRVDLADQRAAVMARQRSPEGTLLRETGTYRNATHACTLREGSLTCRETAFDKPRVVGMALETTALETVYGPAFEPNGTITRDGQGLYRYTATALREDFPAGTAGELGTNPVLSEATLLVHPSGRIVEYEITYTTGSDDQRQRGTYVYTTRNVNATRVPDAGGFVSE